MSHINEEQYEPLDLKQVTDVDLDGIDTSDYPDFCDAFIISASYKGRPMTDDELDELNENSEFVYNAVIERLF